MGAGWGREGVPGGTCISAHMRHLGPAASDRQLLFSFTGPTIATRFRHFKAQHINGELGHDVRLPSSPRAPRRYPLFTTSSLHLNARRPASNLRRPRSGGGRAESFLNVFRLERQQGGHAAPPAAKGWSPAARPPK